jgi:hypothetical protein
MIKCDSRDICRGAKWVPPPSPLLPFAFDPEEQGSLEEGKARIVATFGGRIYHVRRRFD